MSSVSHLLKSVLCLMASLTVSASNFTLDQSSNQECATDGEICGVRGVVFPKCCDGMRCADTYMMVGTCKRAVSQLGRPAACAAQGSPCGARADPSQCCEGSECTAYHESFVCTSGGQSCIPAGRVCGYEGSATLGDCCGGFSCRPAERGLLRCQSHQQTCSANHAICSVDGQAFARCCNDLTCTHTFNGIGKCKDVPHHRACAAQGSLCGNQADPHGCCGQMQCKHTSSGEKKCKRDGHSCVPSGHTCGVPGSYSHSRCCGGGSCIQDRASSLWTCH